MAGLTLQVVSDYTTHKKLCRCNVFTYFLLIVVILAVTSLEGRMIYSARTEMKNDL